MYRNMLAFARLFRFTFIIPDYYPRFLVYRRKSREITSVNWRRWEFRWLMRIDDPFEAWHGRKNRQHSSLLVRRAVGVMWTVRPRMVWPADRDAERIWWSRVSADASLAKGNWTSNVAPGIRQRASCTVGVVAGYRGEDETASGRHFPGDEIIPWT